MVWLFFICIVFIFLAIDLGVFNKTPHIISTKEASLWTSVWVSLSLIFSGVLYWLYQNHLINNPTSLSPEVASMKYITGYLVELSLSVDNIFVIALIFTSFQIPQKYQHRILFWGILGAILFRGLMIFFGVLLIHKFHFMNYIFGTFLLFTALKMLFKKEDENFEPKDSMVYKWIGKIIPISKDLDNNKFFTKRYKKTFATPLFVALIVIEVMDMLFATDSVPAILAITSDPFIVFSSNIFAILGLRSMYFFLAIMLEKFTFLEYSLIAILLFVGIKMIISEWYKFPEVLSLGFIVLSLIIGILKSIKESKN